MQANDGGEATAIVEDVAHACDAASWTYAGLRYKVELWRAFFPKGWFAYIHVDPRIPGGGNWFIGDGATLSNGIKLGYTYQYSPKPNCWEVNNSAGVHWHIEAYNITHYACYYPHSANTTLTQNSGIFGAVNSNATYAGAPCW